MAIKAYTTIEYMAWLFPCGIYERCLYNKRDSYMNIHSLYTTSVAAEVRNVAMVCNWCPPIHIKQYMTDNDIFISILVLDRYSEKYSS